MVSEEFLTFSQKVSRFHLHHLYGCCSCLVSDMLQVNWLSHKAFLPWTILYTPSSYSCNYRESLHTAMINETFFVWLLMEVGLWWTGDHETLQQFALWSFLLICTSYTSVKPVLCIVTLTGEDCSICEYYHIGAPSCAYRCTQMINWPWDMSGLYIITAA